MPGFRQLKTSAAHGGERSRGRRKTMRAIDPKRPLHVVLRSSKATGRWSMLSPAHARPIHDLAHRIAARRGIRLYRFANVGNHIHFLILAPSRTAFQSFMREISGAIAIAVTGARKGSALDRKKGATRGFWDHLAFTRIVSWGRDFERMGRYLVKNLFESVGIPMKKLLAQGIRVASVGPDGTVKGLSPPG